MRAASACALTGDMGKAKVVAYVMFQRPDRQSWIDGLNPKGGTPSRKETSLVVGGSRGRTSK